ncbi:MAG: hypothetical protein EOO65_01275 [Methanosarcinales archaeon]|nr:MAG: hypothetical protein EOO65_01275 [Methanosarcinales archaeon]
MQESMFNIYVMTNTIVQELLAASRQHMNALYKVRVALCTQGNVLLHAMKTVTKWFPSFP